MTVLVARPVAARVSSGQRHALVATAHMRLMMLMLLFAAAILVVIVRLAMLAAVDAGPMLLVGVGTALTCDLLDGDGQHRGGRIAPSPSLMRQALHARAQVLPERGGVYAEFADDTDHALASGCEGAALALVERSLGEAQRLLGVRPTLWLHGGGATALRDRMPAHAWVPDAVMRGLARWLALCIA